MPPSTIPDTFYLFAFSGGTGHQKILDILKFNYDKAISESQVSSNDEKYLQFLSVFNDIINNTEDINELLKAMDLFTEVNYRNDSWGFDISSLVENIIKSLLKECDQKYVFEFTVQPLDCSGYERPYDCDDFIKFFYSSGSFLQKESTFYLRLFTNEQIPHLKAVMRKLLKEEKIFDAEKDDLINAIKFFEDNEKPPSKYPDDGVVTREKIQESIDNSKTIVSLAVEGM